ASQTVLNAVFPDLNYKVNTNGSVFAITLQRLAEWRSNVGSTALALVIDFVHRVEGQSYQDTARQLSDGYVFLYEDTDNPDRSRPYRSPFYLQLLASTHLSAIVDHVDIPALNTDSLATYCMHGIFVACTIALERALRFIRDKVIDVDAILE
ncbi:hypothetical protein BV22DRAFT_1135872, partial [Leucogyrophana mollusca]